MAEATLVETQADSQVTQTGDVTESGSDLDEALALLDEVEKPATPDAPSTEAATTGTESPDAEADKALEAVRKSAAEEAASKAREDAIRETQEASQRAERDRQFDGVRQAFGQRAQAIRAWASEKGLEEGDVNALLSTFNAHHAQSAAIVSAQFLDAVVGFAKSNLDEAGAKAFAAKHTPASFQGWDGVFGDLKDAMTKAARNGHVPESRIREAEATGFLKAKRHYQKNPHLLTSQTQTAEGRNQGIGLDTLSEDEKLMSPTVSQADKDVILRKRGML